MQGISWLAGGLLAFQEGFYVLVLAKVYNCCCCCCRLHRSSFCYTKIFVTGGAMSALGHVEGAGISQLGTIC
jgi:hypothetical protein